MDCCKAPSNFQNHLSVWYRSISELVFKFCLFCHQNCYIHSLGFYRISSKVFLILFAWFPSCICSTTFKDGGIMLDRFSNLMCRKEKKGLYKWWTLEILGTFFRPRCYLSWFFYFWVTNWDQFHHLIESVRRSIYLFICLFFI